MHRVGSGEDKGVMTRSSLRALVGDFRAGADTPDAVLQQFLKHIDLEQSKFNCFSTVDYRGATEAAQRSTERWRLGTPLSPIDGVPISVKDTLPVAGLPTRYGSRVTPTEPASVSAPVVERLINAGAVIVGTTTTAEFGSDFVTINPLTGITRNAVDITKSAGGSSGGAAVSVAAGFCSAAVGTDTAGSIRIPSSFNGVVGLKPTGGRLPTNKASALHTLGSPGPIAASVADCARLFAPMADRRYGADDPTYPDLTVPEQIDLRKVRFASSMRLGFAAAIDPEVEAAIRGLVIRLRDAGCEVREFEPDLADPLSIYEVITQANYALLLRDLNEEQVAQLSPVLRAARAAGLALKASDFLAAQTDRYTFARTLEAALGPYDILITPTVSVPAFAAESLGPPHAGTNEDSGSRVWYPFCYPFNLSAQPALSLPCASTREGLPIGCQLVARVWQDSFLLQVGEQIEKLLDAGGLDLGPWAHQQRLIKERA